MWSCSTEKCYQTESSALNQAAGFRCHDIPLLPFCGQARNNRILPTDPQSWSRTLLQRGPFEIYTSCSAVGLRAVRTHYVFNSNKSESDILKRYAGVASNLTCSYTTVLQTSATYTSTHQRCISCDRTRLASKSDVGMQMKAVAFRQQMPRTGRHFSQAVRCQAAHTGHTA